MECGDQTIGVMGEPGLADVMRAVLDSLPVIVYAIAPDGTVLFAQGRGLEGLGSSSEASVGRSFREVFAGEQESLEHIERGLAGDAHDVVIELRRNRRTYHVWYVPRLDAFGALVMLSGIALDVTEAEHARLRFVATVSHELRTPLGPVLGFCQLLASERYGPLNERQRRYVDNIATGGSHMHAVLNDLLDISSVQSGRLRVELAPVALDVLVDEVVCQLAERAAAAGLRLERGPQTQSPVVADRRRLLQVLHNLVSNAIKYTPAPGRVEVRSSRTGTFARLEVTDSGAGLSAAEQELVFRKFYRAAGATAQEGTGLGLPLSRELARAMGGDVTVKSEPGRGSTFTVLLPVIGA